MTELIELRIAIAFARARWWLACDKACRENKQTDGISEKTIGEVEEAERKYHELMEVKKERA